MIKKNLQAVRAKLLPEVTLVAVSKTKPIELLMEAYNEGQRIFGENKVQELCDKQEQLPKDIEWHMIGHLQRNKVKYIAPFVFLIHGVDSERLLKEINKQALKNNTVINCLLQIHIAEEETKFGFSIPEVTVLLSNDSFADEYKGITVKGLMAMASNTSDENQVGKEFKTVKQLYDDLQSVTQSNVKMDTLSMGMSGDFELAMKCGSNMVRVGSTIFGHRN